MDALGLEESGLGQRDDLVDDLGQPKGEHFCDQFDMEWIKLIGQKSLTLVPPTYFG